MNSKTIVFALIASVSFTQTFNQSKPHLGHRGPASENSTQPKKKAVKKVVTQKEMNLLKDKLSKLENDLKDKEQIIAQKSLEIEQTKSAKENERIEKLNKMLEDQRQQISLLSEQIKNTEVSNVTIVNQEIVNIKNDFNVILCQANQKQSKLEDEIKKLLKDKEDVVKEVADLKAKNEELKTKPIEVKKAEEKAEEKIKEKDEDALSNKKVVAMMEQITNMLMSQQQAQSQMQMQMFSMMNSMSSMNMGNQFNPYSNQNLFMGQNPYMNYGYESYSYNPGYSWGNFSPYSSHNQNFFGYQGNTIGVGIGSNIGYSQSQSVYSQSERSPSAETPQIRGFDFVLGNEAPLKQPEFIQLERNNMI